MTSSASILSANRIVDYILLGLGISSISGPAYSSTSSARQASSVHQPAVPTSKEEQDRIHINASATVSSQATTSAEHNITAAATQPIAPYASNITAGANPDALSCQSLWLSYSSSSSSWYAARLSGYYPDPNSTVYDVSTRSFDELFGTADVYTTISGIPYAHGTFTPGASSEITTRLTSTDVFQVNAVQPFTMPSCTIGSSECNFMYKSYFSSLGLNTSRSTFVPWTTNPPANSPRCAYVWPSTSTTSTVSYSSTSNSSSFAWEPFEGLGPEISEAFWDPCVILGNKVQLFYWDDSSSIESNSTHNLSQPVTQVYSFPGQNTSVTFTSPSVYLKLDTVSAVSWLSSWTMGSPPTSTTKTLGAVHTSVLLTLQPQDASSVMYSFGSDRAGAPTPNLESIASVIAHGGPDYMQWMSAISLGWGGGYQGFTSVYPIEYSNIKTPVPTAYYLNANGAFGCSLYPVHPLCSTIFEGAYYPQINLASGIKSLDPMWSSCDDAVQGLYDPPVALTPQSAVATPIPAPKPYTTPAQPAQHITTTSVPSSHVNPPVDQATTHHSSSDGTTPSSNAVPTSTTRGPSTIADPSSAASPSSEQGSWDPFHGSSDPVTNTVPDTSAGASKSVSERLSNSSPTYSANEPVGSAPSDPPATTFVPSNDAWNNPTTPDPVLNSISVPATSVSDAESAGVSYATTSHEEAGAISSTDHTAKGTLNALSVLSQAENSAEDNTMLSGAVFTASNGQLHTAVDPSGNVVVDNSVTIAEGETATVSSLGNVYAGSSGLSVDGHFEAYTNLESSGAAPTDGTDAPFTIGSEISTATSASVLSLGTAVLSAGGPAITSAGETASLASHGIVVDGSTYSFAAETPAPTQAAVFTVGSSAYTVLGAPGMFVFGHNTMTPGQVIVESGTTISDASSALIVGTSTIYLSSVNAAAGSWMGAVITDGSAVYTAVELADGAAVVDGTTLSSGGSALTINGHVMSDASSGLVVDGTNTALFSDIRPQITSQTMFTIGSQIFTAVQVPGETGVAEVDGMTLSVGGPAITIGGQLVTDGPSGVVIGGTQTVGLSAASRSEGHSQPTGSANKPSTTTSGAITHSTAALRLEVFAFLLLAFWHC